MIKLKAGSLETEDGTAAVNLFKLHTRPYLIALTKGLVVDDQHALIGIVGIHRTSDAQGWYLAPQRLGQLAQHRYAGTGCSLAGVGWRSGDRRG